MTLDGADVSITDLRMGQELHYLFSFRVGELRGGSHHPRTSREEIARRACQKRTARDYGENLEPVGMRDITASRRHAELPGTLHQKAPVPSSKLARETLSAGRSPRPDPCP